MAAIERAEIKWLRGLVADVRSGRLKYPTLEEMPRLSAMGGPSEQALGRIAAEQGRASAAPRRRKQSR